MLLGKCFQYLQSLVPYACLILINTVLSKQQQVIVFFQILNNNLYLKVVLHNFAITAFCNL